MSWYISCMPTSSGVAARLSTTARQLRSTSGALTVMALVVGATTGLGAVVFRWLITQATWIFTGHADYSAVGLGQHPPHPWLPWLGPWFVVLVPAVGGLIYGPMIQRWAPEARGHGVPEVMLAVSQRGGRIAGRVAVVKSLASAITIGSGGSVGREGPIVQIGSALGSRIAQCARLSETKVRTLVACGAASGIAATFNAPIAGVFFALELLLRDFTAESFGMVVLAAVVASVIGRAILGDVPFLQLPAFEVHHAGAYVLFAVLGVIAGVVGVIFTRVLYGTEDLADKLWKGPEWARPAVGGLVLGLLLLALPQMYGVGYPVLQAGVQGKYVIGVLLLLMVAKVVATSPEHRDRRVRRRVRPEPVHRRHARRGVRRRGRPAVPGLVRTRGRLRDHRHGRGVRRRGASADHGGADPVRAHRRVHDHPAADARDRAGHRGQPGAEPGQHLHPQAAPARHRDRRAGGRPAAEREDPRRRHGAAARIDRRGRWPCRPPRAACCPAAGAPCRWSTDGLLVGQLRADRVAAAMETEDSPGQLTVSDVIDDVPRARTTTVLRRGLDALRRHEYPDGGLAVTDDEGRLVGWVTHRTLLRTLTAPVPLAPSAPAGTALARLRPVRGGGSRLGDSASRRAKSPTLRAPAGGPSR